MAGAKKLDVKQIVTKNKNVDATKLRQGLDALEDLRKTGIVRPSQYGLETPETKRSVRSMAHSPRRTTARRVL